ncbi:MAG: ribosome recycling factor [Armatimonadetes bacterium]|nr:ribosome recycling factor [Armatimonadota bacterium]
MEELYQDAERRMKHAIEVMVHDFQTIRTGRANPIVLERVHVEYYGAETPLNQIANINITDPRQLTIQPYEKNMLGVIEKAILKSDLGITPTNDGTAIRLNFPPMSEDRRKEMVKQVNHRSEQAIIAVRNVRRDAIEHAKTKQKNKEISEDDLKAFEAKIQKLTDKYVEESHAVSKKKDAELMEV